MIVISYTSYKVFLKVQVDNKNKNTAPPGHAIQQWQHLNVNGKK